MGYFKRTFGKHNYDVWRKYVGTKGVDAELADKSINSPSEKDEREAPDFASDEETKAYRKDIMAGYQWSEQHLLLFENIFTHPGVTSKNPDVEERVCEVLDDFPKIDEVFTRLGMKMDDVIALIEDALPGYRGFCIDKRKKQNAKAADLEQNTL